MHFKLWPSENEIQTCIIPLISIIVTPIYLETRHIYFLVAMMNQEELEYVIHDLLVIIKPPRKEGKKKRTGTGRV